MRTYGRVVREVVVLVCLFKCGRQRVRQRGMKQKQSGKETIKKGEGKLKFFPPVFFFSGMNDSSNWS